MPGPMGGGNPNEIVISFKASVDFAIKQIEKLKNVMADFGKGVKKIEDAINGPDIDKFGNKMKVIDRTMMRTIERLGLLAVMSRNVKEAFDAMFGAGSKVSTLFTALSEGALIFSGFAQLAKDNLGLLAAGIAGLLAAALLFTSMLVKARIEATEAMTDQTVKSQKAINEFKETMDDAVKTGETFGDTFGEQMTKRLQLSRAAYEQTFKQLRELRMERAKLFREAEAQAAKEPDAGKKFAPVKGPLGLFALEEVPTTPGDPDNVQPSEVLKALRGQVEAADNAIERLTTRLNDLETDAAFLKLADQMAKFSTALRASNDELRVFGMYSAQSQQLAEVMQGQAAFGENMPEKQRIMNSQQELELRKNIFENTVKDIEATKALVQALQVKLDLGTIDLEQRKQLEQLTQRLATSEEDIAVARSGVIDAQAKLRAAQAPQEFTNAFTIPFSNAIGDAVINGMIQGKKGVEILADLMNNLFSAALNDVMKRFQQGMIDVFKSIAGAGGELLGAALITVVGVVAGVLGKKSSSTDTFDKIKNEIQSTQALRGVVAGPQNIAIGVVGESIARANRGIEARLDILIQATYQIRDRIGGVPFAGSVTT